MADSGPSCGALLASVVLAYCAWWSPVLPLRSPAHLAECHSELRQIADLAAEVAWWRAVAVWLAGLALALLLVVAALAWSVGCCGGLACGLGTCCSRREPRQLPRLRAAPLELESSVTFLPAGARRSAAVRGHGVRLALE